MNQVYHRESGGFFQSPEREKTLLSLWAISILPLLMLFPRSTGWVSGPLVLWGIYILIKYKTLQPMDRFFAAFCLILPASFLFNMLFMGWALNSLARPNHLIAGFFIYVVIGRYGLHRNVLFWSACAGALIAFCIAMFEAVYLGNERVFGLSRRWNAVPFGNFSLLLSFSALPARWCLLTRSVVLGIALCLVLQDLALGWARPFFPVRVEVGLRYLF